MSHALSPPAESIDLARDEITHYVLHMCAHSHRITRLYDHKGRPTVFLDGQTPHYRLDWYLTILLAWRLVQWGRATAERDVAVITPLGADVLARWERQMFRGDK